MCVYVCVCPLLRASLEISDVQTSRTAEFRVYERLVVIRGSCIAVTAIAKRYRLLTSPAEHHRRHNGRFSGKLHGFSRMSIPRLLYPRAPAGIKRPLQVSRAKGPFCHTTDNVRVPSETQSVDANQWSGLKPTFIHPRTLEATWPAAVYTCMPLLTDVRTGSPTSTHRIVVSYVTILPSLPT